MSTITLVLTSGTDITTALQNAASQVGPGGTIYLPSGAFDYSNVVNLDGVTLVGSGPGAGGTVLVAQNPAEDENSNLAELLHWCWRRGTFEKIRRLSESSSMSLFIQVISYKTAEILQPAPMHSDQANWENSLRYASRGSANSSGEPNASHARIETTQPLKEPA